MSFIKDVLSSIETVLTTLGATTDVSKTSGTDILAGDVEILDVSLVSQDGNRKFSLMDHAKGIQIFKSIMSPVIFAELNISDSIGLLESFPILKEEYATISIRTPKNNTALTLLFRVNDIFDYEVHENNKNVTYTLQLVSADMLKNSRLFVKRKFNGAGDELINKILKDDLQTAREVTVEKTSGIISKNLHKMRPFEAIDYIRQKSYSVQYNFSRLFFFEGKKGYRLVSLAKLMDDGAKSIAKGTDKEFFFDTHRKIKVEDINIRNIIAYNRPTSGDACSVSGLGGFTNSVNALDTIMGNLNTVTYTDNKGSDTLKTASGNDKASLNSSTYTRTQGSTTSATRLVPISSANPKTQYPAALSVGIAEALKVDQNKIQIYIYGDTDIDIGDMITCHLPAATSIDNGKTKARLNTGNYLVSKVRHIILNSDRPQHTMALELIKGDFAENA